MRILGQWGTLSIRGIERLTAGQRDARLALGDRKVQSIGMLGFRSARR